MLLTLDVGNTNTVLGVFRGQELVAHWRLTTARDQTIDEYGILTRDLFTLAGLEPREIDGVIISSVVPPLNATLAGMAERYFSRKALFVEPGIKTGMPVQYDNPQEVGADRIVNSVAAFEKYGGPCIIVDFGTAINFDAVSGARRISGRRARAGHRNFGGRAFRARRAPVSRRNQGSGQSDRHEHRRVDAVGPFYGYTDMVDGILDRMKKVMGAENESDRHRRPSRADRTAPRTTSKRSTNFSRSKACASSGNAISTSAPGHEFARRKSPPTATPTEAATFENAKTGRASSWNPSTTSTTSRKSRNISGGSAARICWSRRSIGPLSKRGRRPASRCPRC